MARKLTAGIVLRDPDTGGTVFLPAGSEVPEWATDEVGDHVLADSAESGSASAARSVSDDPPPKVGPGSSREKWLDYADAHDVRLRDDTSKSDVIAACEAAGVRTE